MAGGMGRRDDERETLAQRVANTRARQAGQQSAPAREVEPSPPPVKHAWYDGPRGRQAVLLLAWRNIQGRYDGRICVAVPDEGGWAIVEMWVDGAMLSPA
ncbi:hypothetical protein EUA93_00525 [Nocardioides oleivorans]|uniref:Uncharacterized protein n=1 Tax=Nocardioides oleivorans TaxID=273676 RepID=A0A4Q2RV84_9ACTN|nr:hypothetical protein [Nocardioides oleivorans]RYB92967.1 hypothetical protein EUA93_00525 [Nocardioides oleivorans]